MLGGQLTSQMVPPDEHYWIEPSKGAYGQTQAYANLRKAVRDSYKRYRPVTDAFKANSEPDPGAAWVSRLTAEPMVWRNRIDDLLQPYVDSGKLRILYNHVPVSAAVANNVVSAVVVQHENGELTTLAARYFIDSTELGDLLEVAGIEHTIGREAGTGELHNPATVADPADQQSFTWVAAVGYNRTKPGDYRTAEPPNYAVHKPSFDRFFAENLFDPTRDYSWDAGPGFWQYRRVVAQSQFAVPVEEVTLLNYACNDFKGGPILGCASAERAAALAGAKNLTACLIHYLQNHIPRRDGSGNGYPGLRLRPDIAGTADGYAAYPYIREARRLVSIGRIWEWHVGVDDRPGSTTATQFADSVGTGHYWLDVHGGPVNPQGLWLRCYTYQVPFMALIPRTIRNVLAGGKTLGVSHVSNGAYRLHPTEWTVGEAAGVAAHYAIAQGRTPAEIRANTSLMGGLQSTLRGQGAQLEWPVGLRDNWQE